MLTFNHEVFFWAVHDSGLKRLLVQTGVRPAQHRQYSGIIQHVVMNLIVGTPLTLTICLPRHLVTKTQAPNMEPCGQQEAVGMSQVAKL